jgi:hypothetical protein
VDHDRQGRVKHVWQYDPELFGGVDFGCRDVAVVKGLHQRLLASFFVQSDFS